ncbi:hypothetical protein [Bacteroides sp.]|uniref:hypothetical protein n=1 Tax=Bacteroides sp. TaxID=29523 RepID=UPI00402A24FA
MIIYIYILLVVLQLCVLKDQNITPSFVPGFQGAIRFFKRNKAFLGEKQVVPLKGTAPWF